MNQTYTLNRKKIEGALESVLDSCRTVGAYRAVESLNNVSDELDLADLVLERDPIVERLMSAQLDVQEAEWKETNQELAKALDGDEHAQKIYLAEHFFNAIQLQALGGKRDICFSLLDGLEQTLSIDETEVCAKAYAIRGKVAYERAELLMLSEESDLLTTEAIKKHYKSAISNFSRAIKNSYDIIIPERAQTLHELAILVGLNTVSGKAIAKLAVADYQKAFTKGYVDETLIFQLDDIAKICSLEGNNSFVIQLGDNLLEQAEDSRLKQIGYRALSQHCRRTGDLELNRWYDQQLQGVENV